MIRTHLNPSWLDRDRYIDLLNHAFPGVWDRTAFDWYSRREFGGARPDILVRADEHEVIAGLTMVPRQVRVGCDPPVDLAVLSAGGTLPSQRRSGHYAELLRAALERARERAWTALLGFVTEGNGSGRGLLRLGARVIPSFYLSKRRPSWRSFKSSDFASPERAVRAPDVELPVIGHSTRRPRSAGCAQFHYASAEDWRRQFVERPHGVRAHTMSRDSRAWIETVGSTDRLQRLDCPSWKTRDHLVSLARTSASIGRSFFSFSLDAQLAAAAHRRGFTIRRGHFLLLPVDSSSSAWRTLSTASWNVQSGDRL